jgi:putative transposase
MQFEKTHIYHIYNQGNNRQKIFFDRENYLFFLRKIGTYILPYSDILAWCLMPNHFHFMVLVNFKELPGSVGVTWSHTDTNPPSHTDTGHLEKLRTFNDSIGIMLRSYTRAINKQRNRSGKLFREATKAECVTCTNNITPSFYNTNSGTQINILNPEKQYPEICFHYIHQNPVVAKLVEKTTDWEFSSARDYAGLRNGKLVNKEIAKQYIINL